MATQVTTKGGKTIILENPAERAKRYAKELKERKGPNGQPLTAA